MTSKSPDDDQIRALAYQLWEIRGRRDGGAQQDWFDAEQELRRNAAGAARRASLSAVDASIDSSFPASDPPASRLPDVPPANAAAKWAAAAAADQEHEQDPPRGRLESRKSR